MSGYPIVNLVRTEGSDLNEFEFDVLALRNAASTYGLLGTTLLSVAVGFQVWNGPITNLVSEDFYVSAQ